MHARAEAQVRVAGVRAVVVGGRPLGEVPVLDQARPCLRAQAGELVPVVDVRLAPRLAEHRVDAGLGAERARVPLQVEQRRVALLQPPQPLRVARSGCGAVARARQRNRVAADPQRLQEREDVPADQVELAQAVGPHDLDAQVGRAVVEPHHAAGEGRRPPRGDVAVEEPRVLVPVRDGVVAGDHALGDLPVVSDDAPLERERVGARLLQPAHRDYPRDLVLAQPRLEVAVGRRAHRVRPERARRDRPEPRPRAQLARRAADDLQRAADGERGGAHRVDGAQRGLGHPHELAAHRVEPDAVFFAPLGAHLVIAGAADREDGDRRHGSCVGAARAAEREDGRVVPGRARDERRCGGRDAARVAADVPLYCLHAARLHVELDPRGYRAVGRRRHPVEDVAHDRAQPRARGQHPHRRERHGDVVAAAARGRRLPAERALADRALGGEPRAQRRRVGGEPRVGRGERVALRAERAARRVRAEVRPVPQDPPVVEQVELVPVTEGRGQLPPMRPRARAPHGLEHGRHVDKVGAGHPHERQRRPVGGEGRE